MKGAVKFFDAKKGFGFITSSEAGSDVFVYFKDIQMEGFKVLKENEAVEFEVEKTAKGLKAINVKIIK